MLTHRVAAWPPGHAGVGTVFRERRERDEVVPVETVTLDRLTEDWPRVDFVKIDAEESEEAIWRGMDGFCDATRTSRS